MQYTLDQSKSLYNNVHFMDKTHSQIKTYDKLIHQLISVIKEQNIMKWKYFLYELEIKVVLAFLFILKN